MGGTTVDMAFGYVWMCLVGTTADLLEYVFASSRISQMQSFPSIACRPQRWQTFRLHLVWHVEGGCRPPTSQQLWSFKPFEAGWIGHDRTLVLDSRLEDI